MLKRISTFDLEGPLSKNDNAFEITERSVPDGNILFPLLSKYDDVLADVFHRPNYKAGDTLRLILPFLRAYGVTSEKMADFSSENVLLVPGAKETLETVRSWMPSYIVSTSYEYYVGAVCGLTGFPFENAYCTKVDMDRYDIGLGEKRKIRKFKKEIVKMPMIEITEGAKSLEDFSERDQMTIKRLDEIIWEEISQMEIGRMLEEVNPIGGYEKAEAVKGIVKKEKAKLENVIYFGDSITDVDPFKLVRENGGMTVSFNGNRYAIREAEIAVLSKDTSPIRSLAHAFKENGNKGVLNYVQEWEKMFATSKIFPKIKVITDENRETLANESSAFRKTVRGEAIGRLG